jgi:hypothetical protein
MRFEVGVWGRVWGIHHGQAFDHQRYIAALRVTSPPRCLTLSCCQGSTSLLGLELTKRLAFDS